MTNMIFKKNLAITIGMIFFVLILICIIWLCTVVTDFIRYKTESIPIFAFNVTISDLENGYIEEYKGLGYKYVEKNIDNVKTCEFYLLGLSI